MPIKIFLPGPMLLEYSAKFHHDFPYDRFVRADNVVIESAEGTRFHYPFISILKVSTVFSDASAIARHGHSRLQPIVLTFAPAAGLHYFLSILLELDKSGAGYGETGDRVVPQASPAVTILTVRICHILDSPAVGRAILSRADLDVYVRYTIERTFELPVTIAMNDSAKTTVPRARASSDLSFSLNQFHLFKQSLELLQETNLSAVKSLAKFHHDRQKAISNLMKWWSTGIPLGRVLRSDHPPKIVHHRMCKARYDSSSAFARRLPDIVPKAMTLLAGSKTKAERAKNIRALLAREAKGCSGCLTRLEAVYIPELRSFDAAFPATPR